LSGAGRAAEAAGDRARATTFYRRLLELASDADGARPELEHARTFVAAIREGSTKDNSGLGA
jgi:hypothetical protein